MSQLAKLQALLGRVQTRRAEPRLVAVAETAAEPAPAIDLPEPPATSGFPPEAPSEARRRSIPSPLELAVEVELDRPAPAVAEARPAPAPTAPIEIEVETGPEIDLDEDEEARTPTTPPPATAPSARPAARTSVIDLPAAALVDASVPPPEPEAPVAVARGAEPVPAGPIPIAAARAAPPSTPIARVVGDAHALPQAPSTFGQLMGRTLALRLRNAST